MSDDPAFDEPQRVAINRVYTRRGDAGETRLVGGQLVSKSSARIATYGEVDELNACVGLARVEIARSGVGGLGGLDLILHRVQHELFNLGSILATLPADVHPKQPRIRASDIAQLEGDIDRFNEELPPLRSFVLPGGTAVSAALHLCRTVCRRVERVIVAAIEGGEEIDGVAAAWVNRLSDAFFVWSRAAVSLAGADEVLWSPNAGGGSGE